MKVLSKSPRVPASCEPSERGRRDHSEDPVFLAIDSRSPLSFFQRLGLILWLGESGRYGTWV
jgi:hypothetical protein